MEHKKQTKQIIGPEAIVEHAFDYAPVGIGMLSTEGNWLMVNKTLCRLLDYNKEALLQLPIQSLIHPDDLARSMQVLREMVVSKLPVYRLQKRLLPKKGSGIWVQVDISAIDHEDLPTYFIMQIRDISAEKALVEKLYISETRFRVSFDHAPTGMAIISQEGDYIAVNQALCKLLGYSEQDLSQKHFSEVIHPADKAQIQIQFDNIFKQPDNHFELEQRLMHKSGRIVWVRYSANAIRDEAGQFVYAIQQVIDITEGKAAQEALRQNEARLKTILAKISEGIIVQTQTKHIIEYNDAAEAILAMSEAQYRGDEALHPQRKSFKEDGSPSIKRTFSDRALETQLDQGGVIKIHKPGGEISWVRVKASPVFIPEQNQQMVISTFTDITDLRKANEALKNYASKLESSNRDLLDFAYIASHDLQEPLRMISNFLQLLKKRLGDELDTRATSYVDFAIDGATRMKVMINNLLDYSRVESKGQALVPICSHRVLEQALLNLSIPIQESQAEINHAHLPMVMGDEGQLLMVFQNLLSNALKFQPEVQRPHIHIEVNPAVGQEQTMWHFSISDNGIGIPTENLEHIFTIFQRLHSREQFEGSGIGLAICRRIIERHGGTIWAESSEGRGTHFSFLLPKTSEDTGVVFEESLEASTEA